MKLNKIDAMRQLVLFAWNLKESVISNKSRPTAGRYQIHFYQIVVP